MNGGFLDDIAAHAARDPRAPALVEPDAITTYGELTARVDRLARMLAARGVGPEHVCAVAVDRTADAVVAVAAVLSAGGAFLTLDTGQPRERLAAMTEGAGARSLLTTADLRARLDLSVGADDPVLLDLPWTGDHRPSREHAPLPAPDPRSLAYVSHTSGSTGTPNAVLVERRGLDAYLRFVARDYGLGPGTVALQLAPLGYDASIRDIFAPLVAGGRLVLLPRTTLMRPAELTAAIRAYAVDTLLSVTPTFLTHLARGGGLPPLSLVASSGESLRPFLASGGRALVTGRLVNQYGPTECTMTSTRFDVPAEPDTEDDLVGGPVDGTSVHLLDDALLTVPDGGTGEVFIGGAGVARGYGGRPALTAERFVPDPDGGPGARMYRTGDLARRLPDGDLVYLGRNDRQIKIRGYRVDPGEIEGVLLGHPGVTGAVVVPVPDDFGRIGLTAHLTGDVGATTDAALRAYLARTLPHYMLPRRFVRLGRIPLTVSGKADRAALIRTAGGAR